MPNIHTHCRICNYINHIKENGSVIPHYDKKDRHYYQYTSLLSVALQQSLLALKITYSNWKIQGRTESATIYYAGKKFITLSCNLQTNEWLPQVPEFLILSTVSMTTVVHANTICYITYMPLHFYALSYNEDLAELFTHLAESVIRFKGTWLRTFLCF